MLIFVILIFGLATVRAFTSFLSTKEGTTEPTTIGKLLVAITMLISYIWFLNYLVDTN
jgi:phosphatidylglycerophosphate synthase